MGGTRFYLAFVPWIIFDAVSRAGGLSPRWAGAAAFLSAVAIATVHYRLDRSTTSLERYAVGFFAILTTISLFAGTDELIGAFGRAIAAGALGIFAIASTRGTPLTEQYTRQVVASKYWHAPSFRGVNAQMSLLWGAICLSIGSLHVIGGFTDTPLSATLTNWIGPICLAMIGVHLTERSVNKNFDEPGGDLLGLADLFSD